MSDALQAWVETTQIKPKASLSKAYNKVKSLEEDNLIVDLDFSFAKCVRLLEEIKQVDDDTYMKTLMEKFIYLI